MSNFLPVLVIRAKKVGCLLNLDYSKNRLQIEVLPNIMMIINFST